MLIFKQLRNFNAVLPEILPEITHILLLKYSEDF